MTSLRLVFIRGYGEWLASNQRFTATNGLAGRQWGGPSTRDRQSFVTLVCYFCEKWLGWIALSCFFGSCVSFRVENLSPRLSEKGLLVL